MSAPPARYESIEALFDAARAGTLPAGFELVLDGGRDVFACWDAFNEQDFDPDTDDVLGFETTQWRLLHAALKALNVPVQEGR
ncbi:hypothetical protein [Deinococcus humi]|uniref:Uncharacterized protein n=1 Tax=Deinococcus humi TaxID=662880 RepID=A0A7W8JSP9_9DEIO|nr:hypothetical protein [Deinococcus humi]MBB5361293.1 hypothetical protein [Deinococcus humi]GGO19353.1 hypothetical protein GCM10008949_03590 [Deinococcus humi]